MDGVNKGRHKRQTTSSYEPVADWVLEEQFNGNSQIESLLSEKQCKELFSRPTFVSRHFILSSYAIHSRRRSCSNVNFFTFPWNAFIFSLSMSAPKTMCANVYSRRTSGRLVWQHQVISSHTRTRRCEVCQNQPTEIPIHHFPWVTLSQRTARRWHGSWLWSVRLLLRYI